MRDFAVSRRSACGGLPLRTLVRYWRKVDFRTQTDTLLGETVAGMAPAFWQTDDDRPAAVPTHPADITGVLHRMMMAVARKVPAFWSSRRAAARCN